MHESMKKKNRKRDLVKSRLFPTCSERDTIYRKSNIYLKWQNNVLPEGQ